MGAFDWRRKHPTSLLKKVRDPFITSYVKHLNHYPWPQRALLVMAPDLHRYNYLMVTRTVNDSREYFMADGVV